MPGLGWVGQALWEVPEVVRGGGQGSSWSRVSNEGQPEAGAGGGEGAGRERKASNRLTVPLGGGASGWQAGLSGAQSQDRKAEGGQAGALCGLFRGRPQVGFGGLGGTARA